MTNYTGELYVHARLKMNPSLGVDVALMLDTVIYGDSFDILPTLPSGFVHTICTSPPSWGLRDPGSARRWFGGDPECSHDLKVPHKLQGAKKGQVATTYSCSKCEAWHGQFGLEPSPELYTEHLVGLATQMHRILRNDGTFWLNLDDSYFPAGLVGMPWRIAFELQKNGWALRSAIIWDKTNATPESVRNRPSTSYEHMFLFSKSPEYYYDWFAGLKIGETQDGRRLDRDIWRIPLQAYKEAPLAVFPPQLPRRCIQVATSPQGCCARCGRPVERVIQKERLVSVGWRAPCPCDAGVKPCVVFDPFAGSGTTLAEAREQHCSYLGVESNSEYRKLIEDRLEKAIGHGSGSEIWSFVHGDGFSG